MTTKSLLHSSLLDNQYYTSMLAGNAAYDPLVSDFFLLETVELTADTSQIIFSNLVSTYSADFGHLQVRGYLRPSTTTWIAQQFNGVTSGQQYVWKELQAYNGTNVINTNRGKNYNELLSFVASNAANDWTSWITDYYDAFDTTKGTTFRTIKGGRDYNANPLQYNSGGWSSTAALDQIRFFPLSGGNLLAGTRISLYGSKVA